MTNYHFHTEYLQNSELESYGQENNRGGWKHVLVSESTFINENKNLKMTKILLTYRRVILAITYNVIINYNANHNTSARLTKIFDFVTQNQSQRH